MIKLQNLEETKLITDKFRCHNINRHQNCTQPDLLGIEEYT